MESKGLLFLCILTLLAPSWVSPSPVPDDDGRDGLERDEYDDSPSDSDYTDRESSEQNDQSDNYSNRSNDDRDEYNTKSNEDNDDHSNRRFDNNDDYSKRREDDDDYSDRREDHRDNDWRDERRNKGTYGDDYGNRMEDNGEGFYNDDEGKWKTKKRGKSGEEERNNDEYDYDRARNSVKGSQSRITSGGISVFTANSVCIFVGVVICHVQHAIPLL